jgi:hypothetical protein
MLFHCAAFIKDKSVPYLPVQMGYLLKLYKTGLVTQ